MEAGGAQAAPPPGVDGHGCCTVLLLYCTVTVLYFTVPGVCGHGVRLSGLQAA